MEVINRQIMGNLLKSTLMIFVFAGILFIPQRTRADLATPFVESNNQPGDISEAYGWVAALGSKIEDGNSFLVIVRTDTMDHVVLRATAEKGIVTESMLGRWGIIKAQIASRVENPTDKRTYIQLKILSLKSVEKRYEEFGKEYEDLMANEQKVQKELKQIENLKFHTEPYAEGMLATWIQFKQLPPLNIVTTVSENLFKTKDEDITILSKLTEVKNLWLNGTKITDKGLSNIAGLKKLEGLYIGDTKVSDSGLIYLKDLSELNSIWLRGTEVSDNSIKYLKHLSKLEYLDISRTNIGDAAMMNIKDLASLRTLNINSTNVTDKGIALLKDMKNLQYLDLYNTKTTQGGRGRLVKIMPELKINIEAPPIEH